MKRYTRKQYTEARKTLDDFVISLITEIPKRQKQHTFLHTSPIRKDLMKARQEITNLKKKMHKREIVLLKEIDRLKQERDRAELRLQYCAMGSYEI